MPTDSKSSFDDSAIIRTHKNPENPYAQISRELLNDSRLSWAARGLLSYLLSKPDNWEIQMGDLINQGDLKRDAIRKVFTELKKLGYMYRTTENQKENGGRLKWITEIYENPTLNPRFLQKYPSTGLPATARPATENPPFNNKESNNKENTKKSTPPAPPDSSKKERQRDLIFDGFVIACGYDPHMIDGHRGAINKNAAILRRWYKNKLTDEQLHQCLIAFPEWFYLDSTKDGKWRAENKVKITAPGIIKHWQGIAEYIGLPKIAEA